MLMAPVFAILFGPVQTVAVIILMEIVVTGQLLPGVRREIDWKVIAPMGIAGSPPHAGGKLASRDARSRPDRKGDRAGRGGVLGPADGGGGATKARRSSGRLWVSGDCRAC